MMCSPEEIERKRQAALQKLTRRTASPLKSEARFSPFKTHSSFSKTPYEKPNLLAKNANKLELKCNFYGHNKITTAVSLISLDTFSVTMSSYSEPLIEMFKTVPSKKYDPKTKIWSFHIKDYDTVISKLNKMKNQNVIVEPLPKFVINCCKSQKPDCDLDFTRIDEKLLETLLPFQLEGLRFGIQHQGRCLIADDMGLGKTFQALAIMNYYKCNWPLLIVTTASMKNVWEETILKYLPSVSIMRIQCMLSTKDYIGDSLVLITSHDLMSRCCDMLVEKRFGCVIIDESHNLKNHKAKMTQAAIKLCKNAERVILLSGTPALSRPKELFTQLCLIDENFFGSFIEYAKRYCDLQQTNFGLDSSGKSNLQELEIILKKHFMIRRRKDDVLGSLPNKTQEIIKLNVDFNSLDKTDKELLENLSIQYTNTKKSVEKQAILLSFFCETAKIKIPAVCAHIQKLLQTKRKFIVFAHHLVMLDAIEKVLKYKNFNFIRIDGSTTGDQRKYFIDKFQTNENYVCALLSITAANAGITLTAAQQVVFAELHWNPSILNQAEARAHRIGQENAVLIQYLLADGTVDDHIWPLLQEKQTILREMGLTKESFSDLPEKYDDSCKNVSNISQKEPGRSTSDSDCFDMEMDENNLLDDGLDEILCNIDF